MLMRTWFMDAFGDILKSYIKVLHKNYIVTYGQLTVFKSKLQNKNK